MLFPCPFTETDGRKYEAGSREAFRRHLTVHHGHDYRRMGNGLDAIVALSGSELSERLTSIRRSQRHRKSKGPAQYVPPPPPLDNERSLPPSLTSVRSVSVVPSTHDAKPTTVSNFGPPPRETAYSPISGLFDDLQESRPDTPFNFDDEPEQYNVFSFLDSEESTFGSLGQPPVDSSMAEATMGHGQLPVDPVVAPPPLDISADVGFRNFLRARGLAPADTAVEAPVVQETHRNMGVQTVDPRIISPSEFIVYRQSFDTLVAATHMALLLRGCTSLDATALADQTAIRLGLPPSDQPSWDALYRMAVTAVIVERHLQVRLAEILAASTVDQSGGLAIAGVLLEMQARQRRPLDVDEMPQPGDYPELFAIMPSATADE